MSEFGIPDPFDDDAADWEGMDQVHLEGMAWDSHRDPDTDGLFALLDHLDVDAGDPAIAAIQNGADAVTIIHVASTVACCTCSPRKGNSGVNIK